MKCISNDSDKFNSREILRCVVSILCEIEAIDHARSISAVLFTEESLFSLFDQFKVHVPATIVALDTTFSSRNFYKIISYIRSHKSEIKRNSVSTIPAKISKATKCSTFSRVRS